MKNLLLVGALCSLTLLPSTAAQSFDENPAQRRVEIIQTARKSIRSEAARTLKTYEQNGRKIAVKETLDGKRRFKAFANRKENLAPVYTAQKEAMPAADEEYTLAEGFEEFANHIDDPDALEWLPEGWTSINTHPNYDDPDALWYSWYITEPSIAKGLPLNPESQYIAYIQYDEYEESDEWLITKPITVKEEDYLFFDLSYLPCYVFYNFYNKDDGIAATMKIKISDNGGESWDLLLDVADLEYTDEELEISDFRRFRIDISDYAGKTVLIAFPIRRSIRRLDATRRSVCTPHAAYRHLQPSARNVPLGCQLQVGSLLDNLDFCTRIQRSRVEQLLQRSLVVSMGLRRRKLRHPDLHGQLFHRHTLGALSHRYVRFAPKFLHLERHSNGRPGP